MDVSDAAVREADVVTAAPWALYEVKDHHYRLLLSGNVRAPERPSRVLKSALQPTGGRPEADGRCAVLDENRTPALAASEEQANHCVFPQPAKETPKLQAAHTAVSSLRERVGAMGILARIGAARSGDDSAVASLFTAGASVDDSVLASLAAPLEPPLFAAIPERLPIVSSGSVTDLGELFTTGRYVLPAYAKRVSAVTARVGGDNLIDRDDEPLDDEHAQRLLQRHKEAFQLCYENVLKSDKSLSGRIVIDVDVGVDGHVMGASPVFDDVASPALARCVRNTLTRIRFPAQPSEDVSLTASLSFEKRP